MNKKNDETQFMQQLGMLFECQLELITTTKILLKCFRLCAHFDFMNNLIAMRSLPIRKNFTLPSSKFVTISTAVLSTFFSH